MEILLFLLFAAGLVVCVAADLSILYAMVFGYALFFGYGIIKKHPVKEMLRFSMDGVRTIKNILIMLAFIGTITAVWRAGGTIAFIVYHASALCAPSVMLLAVFFLCCLVSFLIGTAFGTAATIGVICMTMASGMGVPPLYTGGAILAGVFFGDRCSPMSTSALLTSELTRTDIYRNIVNMVKTSIVPFVITCVVYVGLGFTFETAGAATDVRNVFTRHYNLSLITVLPAVVIVVFSILRLNVRVTLCASSICGFIVACATQDVSAMEMLKACMWGFKPENAELAALMGGGGIVSMVKVMCILAISSSYAGIFKGTGFLEGIQKHMQGLGERITPFGAVLVTAIVTAMISCNQTLNIMLTHQLCGSMVEDREKFASYLEDTAVVVSPLIPWSIAGAVPLATVGAPMAAIFFACYLWLIPLYNLIVNIVRRKRK